MSQRQYAKHIGRSVGWVNKMVQEGVIELFGPKRKIDPIQADAAIEAVKDPTRDAQREANEKRRQESREDRGIFDDRVLPEESLADLSEEEKREYNRKLHDEREKLRRLKEEADKRGVSVDSNVDIKGATLSQVKTFSELYRGKLNQLEFKKRSGDMVTRENVIQDASELGMLLKSKVKSSAHTSSTKISSELGLSEDQRVVMERMLSEDGDALLIEIGEAIERRIGNEDRNG